MDPSSYEQPSGSFRTKQVPQGKSLSHLALRFLLLASALAVQVLCKALFVARSIAISVIRMLWKLYVPWQAR